MNRLELFIMEIKLGLAGKRFISRLDTFQESIQEDAEDITIKTVALTIIADCRRSYHVSNSNADFFADLLDTIEMYQNIPNVSDPVTLAKVDIYNAIYVIIMCCLDRYGLVQMVL